MVIWEIDNHLFGNFRDTIFLVHQGRNSEIHVDVGLHLIFVKGLSDICGRAFVGFLCILFFCKTTMAY
jgi:hypothetical protein